MGRHKKENRYVKIRYQVDGEMYSMYMDASTYKHDGWKPLELLPADGVVVEEIDWD